MEGRKNKEVLTFLLGIAREKRIHMGKKTDEMDRQIQLLSEEREYRVIVLALALWVLYNCWQAFFRGEAYSPLPMLILCLGVSVQSFSQLAIGRKMVEGDAEYQAPNRLARAILLTVAITAILLGVGAYFAIRN